SLRRLVATFVARQRCQLLLANLRRLLVLNAEEHFHALTHFFRWSVANLVVQYLRGALALLLELLLLLLKLEVRDRASDDQYQHKYADGSKGGSCVPVTLRFPHL